MKIGIGADHGGTFLKEEIKAYLQKKGYEAKDVGTWGSDPVDYPDIALEVAQMVVDGHPHLRNGHWHLDFCKQGAGDSLRPAQRRF